MADNDTQEIDVVNADVGGADIIVRDHGPEMSMSDFVDWARENFGGGLKRFLQNAAFMLCCDIIAQDIAKAPLQLREWMDNGTSKVVLPSRHEMAAMLALEPNRWHTWHEFTEMMVLWGCLTSNSYAAVYRSNAGDPLELIPVQTGRVSMKVSGRDIFYDVSAGTQFEAALLGSHFKTFPERDMVHVRYRILDGSEGYSTLDAGRKTLDTAESLEDFRNSLFSEGGQLRGVFSSEGMMPDGEQGELAFQRLRQQYKTLMNKFSKLVEPIVLENGIKFIPIASKPQEMELAKQFTEQIHEVCRLLRVPPHKVFAIDGAKYDNLETLDRAYLSETLEPRAVALEKRLAKMLLSRKDRLRYFFEFDRSKMSIRDAKATAERVVKFAERGIILIDEARAEFGYNPLENGAGRVRHIPVNFIVVDENNEVVFAGKENPKEQTENDDLKAESDDLDGDEKKAVLRLVSSA